MLWATRRGCHVGRTACAWLIKRFVDPEAGFSFFKDPEELRRGQNSSTSPEPGSPTEGRTAPSRLFSRNMLSKPQCSRRSPRSCTTRTSWTRSTVAPSRRV